MLRCKSLASLQNSVSGCYGMFSMGKMAMRGLRRRNALLCHNSLMDVDVCVDFCAESSVVGLYRRRVCPETHSTILAKMEKWGCLWRSDF